MQLENLKSLTKQVSHFAWKYKQAKIKVMMFQPNQGQHLERQHQGNLKFIEAFHFVLDQLVSESRQIIVNDFLENHQHHWWLHFYARSTYYRMKNKAVRELLNYLK